ncbi:putative methyltransferase [Moraxella lacunata]|uniref:site-specific DNA-methyltransferase (adenine-specific) n=1 Tax=Moraxella lacunata TaxID=477 RepID=A0A378TQ87_MORLA|nr:site-specific DNA-methyltransferase [Moraxella lacunata]STZ62887.1 putative methyltransferase [Moraxella lacunata]
MIIQKLFDQNSPVQNEKLTLLKEHFPNCFDKDGHFLPEKMASELQSSDIVSSREFYQLNWLGKSYARYLRDCPPITLFGENQSHNQAPQNINSQNLLIKGDNLEVLKHLKNAYQRAVKMIYIDPPYNTGSDGFVYQDDRKFTPEQLAQLADMSLDEAKRVLDFTAKKSNSHSAWLTFMYPRLYIARELLKDDGVIFISIDDNEQAQLKLLCDEIFGEENFIAQFIINSNSSKNNSKHVSVSHEYMFCYAREKNNLDDEWRVEKLQVKAYQAKAKQLLKMNLSEEEIHQELLQLVKYPRFYDFDHFTFADDKGVYESDNSGGVENGNFDTQILHPITGKPCAMPSGGWRYKDDTLKKMITEGDIIFGVDESIIPRVKRYLHDYTEQIPKSNVYFDSQSTTKWLKSIGIPFSFPKAIELIKHFILIGTDENDFVMDFFAGSGTTAHSTMQLNVEMKHNRKFICVQLPENLDENLKNANSTEEKKSIKKMIDWTDKQNKPHNLFEITKERIIRSAQKIQSENPDYTGDLGFKIFETVDNFLVIDDNEINPQTALPDLFSHTFSDDEYHTLLTTWRVYDSHVLTDKVQSIDLVDYTAYLCDKTLYILYPDFGSGHIKALLDKLDNDKSFLIERIVLFGLSVDSAKQKELAQALTTYNNKKNLNIHLVVRVL